MNLLFFSGLAAELLMVAIIDIKTQKISNFWPLFNLLLFLIFLVAWPSQYFWDPAILIFPVGFVLIGFILFLMNIMGAGDSKFLASLFLLIPVEYHFEYAEKLLLMTMVVGAVLLLRTFFHNRLEMKAFFLSHHWMGILSLIRSRFSYAPVIFLAWILLGMQQWL